MKTVRVDINGYIGPTWWDDGNTSASVIEAIGDAEAGDTLEVHVNSGGGSFFEGLAIYNVLRKYVADGFIVETYVDGLAASAASIIMLAGNKRVVPESAMVMVHNVSMYASGDDVAFARYAKLLSQFNMTSAKTYAARTKETVESGLELMRVETWMDGADAVSRGFATELGTTDEATNQAAAMACLLPEGLKNTPAWLLASSQKPQGKRPANITAAMIFGDIGTAPQPNSEAPPRNTPLNEAVKKETIDMKVKTNEAGEQIEATTADEATIRADVLSGSKASRVAIDNALENGLITIEDKAVLVKDFLDQGKPVSEVREKILQLIEANAKKDPSQEVVRRGDNRVGMEDSEKFADGVTQAVMASAGFEKRDRTNPFASLISPLAIARACLDRSGGKNVSTMGNVQIAHEILNMHTTGDFPLVMENTIDKLVLKGFDEDAEVYAQLCRRITVQDYKEQKMVGTNMFPTMDLVEEGAEYTYGTFGEHGASIAVAKYGKLIMFTEETFINDNMSMLNDIPFKMGQGAKRTIGDLFWGMFLSNPTFNGSPLFSTGRKNLLQGPGSAFSDAGITAADKQFTTRVESDIKADGLTGASVVIEPRFLIIGRGRKTEARRLLEAEYVAAASGVPSNVKNTHADTYELVHDGRIDRAVGGANKWWLAADPNRYDTFGMAFLNGEETPQTSRHEEYKRDAITFKIRQLGVGFAPLSFAGVQQNDGV